MLFRSQVVMEPTGAAWLPIASYLSQRGVKVYLVGTQKVAALRRFYSRHAKSDRVDARLLARMPAIMPDTLYELVYWICTLPFLNSS